MPKPAQDSLTTIVAGCDSEWDITGHTNLEIQGNKIISSCSIDVQGVVGKTPSLTVDFGIDDKSCEGKVPYSFELNEGIIKVNGAEVDFGLVYTSIVIYGSPCRDIIRIKKTYDNTEVVDIRGGAGNGKLPQT
jgi:hypothetical protein